MKLAQKVLELIYFKNKQFSIKNCGFWGFICAVRILREPPQGKISPFEGGPLSRFFGTRKGDVNYFKNTPLSRIRAQDRPRLRRGSPTTGTFDGRPDSI